MSVITRVYDSYTEARRATDAVNGLGLMDVDASLAGNESLKSYHESYQSSGTGTADDATGTGTGAGIGAVVGGGAGLLAGLGMLAIPGIGPLVAAGWLAATAVGAAGGAVAGGAIGAVADLGIAEADVPVYSEAVRRGAILVTARFPEQHRHAVELALGGGPGNDIDQRRRSYEAEGWRADQGTAGLGMAGMNPPLV
ncbi:MAG: hypothetical protein H7317_05020 [Pseudorhodobacter sp.]|nr:hypothetical protein [Pseudorhodobacter sp.]